MTPEAEQYRDRLRAMLPELRERFGVSELGLFGSRIRGDNTPDSDLDVLVAFLPDAHPTLITLVELEYLLSDTLGIKVDLVHKPALKPSIGRQVLAEVQYL